MKGAIECLLVLALTTIALASNNDPSQAPEICAAEGSDGVLVAHEECDKFYKCSEGIPAPLDCPTGLLWNADRDVCDWPHNVKCESKILEKVIVVDSNNKGNADPSEAPEICAAEGSDGVLVAHEECDKFYKCSEGVPAPLDCPTGLLWNADRDVCDWPHNVKCESKILEKVIVVDSNNKGNADPSEAPEICAAEGSDGVLVAHEECDKFYKCSEGVPAPLDCPTGLLWNADRDVCDWPHNVKCESKILEKVIVVDSNNKGNADPSEAPEICAAEGSDGVLVAHEECDKFHKCSEGVPVALDCPTGLLWNADRDVCDWPHNVNCNARITMKLSGVRF